jgi:hypothetical protein
MIRHHKNKALLFEKRRKNFCALVPRTGDASCVARQGRKQKFFGSFFKKEPLPLTLPSRPAPPP